jgi:hypothetical protein
MRECSKFSGWNSLGCDISGQYEEEEHGQGEACVLTQYFESPFSESMSRE